MAEPSITTTDGVELHLVAWRDETVLLCYDAAVRACAQSVELITSIDNKLVTMMTIAAGLLGLTSAVAHPSGPAWTTAIASAILALIGGLWSFRGQSIQTLRGSAEFSADWLELDAPYYRLYSLRDLASSCTVNADVLARKARGLRLVMLLVTIEVLGLALARFV